MHDAMNTVIDRRFCVIQILLNTYICFFISQVCDDVVYKYKNIYKIWKINELLYILFIFYYYLFEMTINKITFYLAATP